MLDLYNVLKLVEQEVNDMRKRQQQVIVTYQQQTREELAKRLMDSTEHLLSAAEAKVKDLNAVEHNRPYIVATNRHVFYIAVKRFKDESALRVSIDPIIYPTAFNLKFIIDEPCIALYDISSNTGIVSLNKRTIIRGIDVVEQVSSSDIDKAVRLWLRDYSNEEESDVKRVLKGIASLRSISTLVEYILTSGKHEKKSTIYKCDDHDVEPMHAHDVMIASNSVREIIRYHIGA